ncbi:hypothetical protein BS47DRAFT_125944 [Hydnum rufescens UP504]|uniref:Uncharacterized protein n=1 Tax=Hydnum rufescens UP504 TaxID=1448309 RepID=A0A9P6B8A6_9AGAM|nr:hypothetical protein BS47DRAFT_125944 [Hydnum rufescens UP504]
MGRLYGCAWTEDPNQKPQRQGAQYRDSLHVILRRSPRSEAQLLRGLRLEMKAEVVFPVDGPTAGDLRKLLIILSEESPEYHLWGENCKWFCSVVQENLTHFYSGELRSGMLSHRDLGKKCRRRIADRFLSIIARGH